MERIILLGVSHRRGGIHALEAWHRAFDQRPLASFQALGFQELVLLSTCNRCDIVFTLPEGMSLHEARHLLAPADWPRCYTYESEAALEQLSRIASSLDSLNPGEYQIMMQMREAYAASEEAGMLGSELRFAFSTAFRIAKRIRREIPLAPLHTSLFSLARPEMEQHLPPHAKIAILGVGKMGVIAARVLAERPQTDLLLVNRSEARAHELAQELTPTRPIQATSLAAFLHNPPPDLHALVCATAQPDLIDEAFLQKLPALRVIVDLGMPRNVKEGSTEKIHLLDVETLQEAGQRRRQKLEQALLQAESLLLDEIDAAIQSWIERQLGASLQMLRQDYHSKLADTLPEREARQIANRFAHLPIKGLRVLAREYGLQAARAFLSVLEQEQA